MQQKRGSMDKLWEDNLDDKDYNEHFAMFLLTELYDQKFDSADVADKPDIQLFSKTKNGKVGVEVTSLKDNYVGKFYLFRNQSIKQQWTIEDIARNIPPLLKGKVSLNRQGKLMFYAKHRNPEYVDTELDCLQDTISTKLRKLQDYKKFNDNFLFIYATALAGVSVDKISQKIKQAKGKFDHSYDKIMLYTYDTLQVYNYKNKPLEIYAITEQLHEYCHNKALIMKQREKRKKDQKKARKFLRKMAYQQKINKKKSKAETPSKEENLTTSQ